MGGARKDGQRMRSERKGKNKKGTKREVKRKKYIYVVAAGY